MNVHSVTSPEHHGRIAPPKGEVVDLLVIGGGLYGATLACRAARAGWKVALIEQGDFGGAASANSLKILHGGLRYLQHVDFPRMRESITSRREGFRALPYLTRPARFYAATAPGFKRSVAAYQIAAQLNDLISFDRNVGVPASHHLPPTEVVSAKEIAAMWPGVVWPGGHALAWSDGLIENTERYTLAYVMSARAAGAVTLNYARVTELLMVERRVTGAAVTDGLTGETSVWNARLTVVTAGAQTPELLPPSSLTRAHIARVRAYNLVVRRRWFGDGGVGLDGTVDGIRRHFFFAPWGEGTLIGTMYKPWEPREGECRLSGAEIADFVRAINKVYPAARLSVSDVAFTHVGIVPGKTSRSGALRPEPSGKTSVLDYRKITGHEGLLAILGVKYTTADYWAGVLVDLAAQRLDKPRVMPENNEPLYGAEETISSEDVWRKADDVAWSMPDTMAAWLARNFGAQAIPVIHLSRANPRLREPVPGSVIPRAAVVHATGEEMAVRLSDVVLRRTDLGAMGYPGDEAVDVVATLMADQLGWNAQRRDEEVHLLRAVYQKLGLEVGE